MEKQQKQTELIAAYLPYEYKELVMKVVESRQESLSTFFRRAILKELNSLGYLDEETRKALGSETFG